MAPRPAHGFAALACVAGSAAPAHALVADMAAWIWASWPATVVAASLAMGTIAYGLLLPLRRMVGYYHMRTGRLRRLFLFLKLVSPVDHDPAHGPFQQPDEAYGMLLVAAFVGALGYGLLVDREALTLALAAGLLGALSLLGVYCMDKMQGERAGRKSG